MNKNPTQSKQDQLRRIWSDAEVIPDCAKWSLLTGGRTNLIWRVDIPGAPTLVCKLFRPNTDTPLFANDGTREALALRALAGSSIAPELVAFQDSTLGETIVYRHIDGQPWSGDVAAVARVMARLHARDLPKGLPELTVTPTSLIADGHGLSPLNLTPPPMRPKNLPDARRVFLHGDIVPGNMLDTSDGLRLIDWQCPVTGDASADIAIFLSPAMQVLYGHRALSSGEIDHFLSAYLKESGDDQTIARYHALAPLYHWRMAAYCRWKSARGDQDYARAASLELDRLEQT
ncbi:phosphotransferase [Aliiroseovarius sp. F47248L]|uniref:phosphotransferase n=1 Tax=Aliiroseovarius sp. F47248L TaxID=2926420 RepID=UPI001FF4B25F|nr:phosphotransferase [Aliiroseovarius sp. F47248L]MCK0140099.1 phosphotransferase [Aliiroseovarius sp. F47248L]